MKRLVMCRGISGSGKSTLARKILARHSNQSAIIISADDYFTNRDTGEYIFNSKELGEAHKYSKLSVKYAMNKEVELVIVDNTNTTLKEMWPYLGMAAEENYKVEIVYSDTDWAWNAQKCFECNKHQVPLETIEKQLARFEKKLVTDVLVIVNEIQSLNNRE